MANFCSMLGIVCATLVVLAPFQAAQIFYAYAEYDNVSSLLPGMSSNAIASLYINIVCLPLSWCVFFASVMQLLPQKDLKCSKLTFGITIELISIAFVIANVANFAVFAIYAYPGLNSSLLSYFNNYSSDSTTKAAWDRAHSKLQCCAVNGPEDLTATGLTSTVCSGLGCQKAIEINFIMLFLYSLIGQIMAIITGLHGLFPFSKYLSRFSGKLGEWVSNVI
ncbi:uncharacterized protein LOC143464602 isoform X2 [Clavelina lepadiformis]|uniref:uncharacterized protein LOC143464602 isoform X2 n=1 Tax=Clavelina lepadiformis TaxID=159417 RepID=UPI0040426799